jgi:hypothetical protein
MAILRYLFISMLILLPLRPLLASAQAGAGAMAQTSGMTQDRWPCQGQHPLCNHARGACGQHCCIPLALPAHIASTVFANPPWRSGTLAQPRDITLKRRLRPPIALTRPTV